MGGPGGEIGLPGPPPGPPGAGPQLYVFTRRGGGPLGGPSAAQNKRPSKPYEIIGLGAMPVTKPYKFTWFGDIHVLKPYKLTGFRWAFILVSVSYAFYI